MITLRPYQDDIITYVRANLSAGKRSVLIQAPTGSGKTALTAHMMASAVAKGKRAWFCVHRRELLNQSVDTLENAAGLDVGVIQAGFGANGYHLAQVASIQTLMRRWEKYPLPDLLIADEAHHLCSPSWSKLVSGILQRSPFTRLIGLTATPTRLDGRGLSQWFEVMVQGPSSAELIEQGYLSKYRLWPAQVVDLSNVHTVAGDYNKHELSEVMGASKVVGDALAEYQKHCAGKRALIFMWSIESSVDMAQRFNDAGIAAKHVDGETPDHERDQAMRDFRSGRLKVLSNVELFGEGLDVPAVEAGFLMRPTQSLGLYLQQCGRLLRPADGKEAALIFDHAGHVVKFGLPDDKREWSLFGQETGTRKKQQTPVRQCLQCFAVLPARMDRCSWCGYVFEVQPRQVKQEAGELQEIDLNAARRMFPAKKEARREQGMAGDYQSLVELGRRRGYRSPERWASYVIDGRNRKFTDQEVRERNRDLNAATLPSLLTKLADQYRPKDQE